MIVPFDALPAYRLLAQALGPLAGLFLRWRLARGKEDGARFCEKMGFPGRPRPSGQLAWLHGASVGEGLALLPLVERLALRGFSVLVTTGTVTSARILAERLGPGAYHQFMPLDVPKFASRFLDHWQPDLVLIAESEIWPNIMREVGRRRLPLMLVNARLSQRSFKRWQSLPRSIARLLDGVHLCLAQTDADAARLRQLGAPRVTTTGNLKYDVPAPPVDMAGLAVLQAATGARPVWLAASTHPGEEAMAGEVHRALARRFPDLLTIVVPRHAGRGAEIAAALAATGAGIGLRSKGDAIEPGTGIYVADTMGETGLFFRLAPVVFVGKSMAGAARQTGGGQNPIEPAKLGSAILHGPHVWNFNEIYSALDAAGGAEMVTDTGKLTVRIGAWLTDAEARKKVAQTGLAAMDTLAGALERTVAALDPYLMQFSLERRGGQDDSAGNAGNA